MALELAWGKIRRAWLRIVRPGYVARMQQLRRGSCPNCPHQVLDYRDLKYYRNVCGYSFGDEERYTRPRWLPLAPLGHAEILVTAILAASVIGLAIIGWYWWHWPGWLAALISILAGVAWCQTLYFFRDPDRAIPQEPGMLVSPADGRVTHVDVVPDADFPEGKALRISIFLSFFDVHLNRAPCAGRVSGRQYFPGRFANALSEKVSADNEQFWTDFREAESGQLVRVKQIAGAVARRIVCWLRAEEEVQRGQRIGLIKFGSRTDLLVPADGSWEVAVRIGQQVAGGSTVLLRRAQLASADRQG